MSRIPEGDRPAGHDQAQFRQPILDWVDTVNEVNDLLAQTRMSHIRDTGRADLSPLEDFSSEASFVVPRKPTTRTIHPHPPEGAIPVEAEHMVPTQTNVVFSFESMDPDKLFADPISAPATDWLGGEVPQVDHSALTPGENRQVNNAARSRTRRIR